jgi:hypothetical protein
MRASAPAVTARFALPQNGFQSASRRFLKPGKRRLFSALRFRLLFSWNCGMKEENKSGGISYESYACKRQPA